MKYTDITPFIIIVLPTIAVVGGIVFNYLLGSCFGRNISMKTRKITGFFFASLLIIAVVGLFLIMIFYKPKTGTVIILNGPSCSGKSSIIKAFQEKEKTPWLSIGIDNFFVGVLPPKFYLEDKPEHHAVMHGVPSVDKEGKLFTLEIGEEGQKIIKGMHRAIAAYARAGNNVIVDYIQYDPAWMKDLKNVLKGLDVIFVGVTASLATLEQREKNRGRPNIEGYVRSHFNTVHQDMKYDLMLNTDELTPEAAAEKIDELLKEKQK